MQQHSADSRPNHNLSKDALTIGLALFPILSIVFLMPIQPNDFWWYLRVAAETIQNHAFPKTEIIAFTQAGQPGFYQHWLAGMLFLGASRLGGLTLVSLVRGLCIGATYFLLFVIIRKQDVNRLLAFWLILIAALAGSNNWAMRPQVLAYPLFGCVLLILDAWEQHATRKVWWLPVITLLWVNIHSSFICLFLLGGACLIFGKGNRRQLLLILLLCAILTGVTPAGFQNWAFLINIAKNPSIQQFASEWNPPTNSGWQMNLFFIWLILFPVLVGGSSKKLTAVDWIWFLGFGWLGLSSLRHIAWFIFVLVILSAKLLSGIAVPKPIRSFQFQNAKMNTLLAVFLILSPLLLLPGIRQRWWTESPRSLAANTPVLAGQYIQDHPNLGNKVWADLAYSSYLAYILPEKSVWIYPRFEIFPPSQFEEYQRISNGADDWATVLQRDRVDLIVGSKVDQVGLFNQAQKDTSWQLEYQDDNSFIFSSK